MFDDNYQTYEYPDAAAEASPEELFDHMVMQSLQGDAVWLQSTARTTREIADHLFPFEMSHLDDNSELRLSIIYSMWDLGYTTASRNEFEVEWRWLEGKCVKNTEISTKNTPSNYVTPPCFISTEGAPYILKREECVGGDSHLVVLLKRHGTSEVTRW